MTMKRIRVLLGKAGLDGHDRGVQVVAKALRDAGMEVVYTGLHHSIESIVRTALHEDVDVVGLSVLSGAHMALAQQLIRVLRKHEFNDRIVVMGGTIPPADVPKLSSIGIHRVFPVGTPLSKIQTDIKEMVEKERGQ
jgi:methylmalonyl-CoA mutase C-terminal domain/subunit